MLLNKEQIQAVQNKLEKVKQEQERILSETEQVVMCDLSNCWECAAQKAYEEAFQTLKNSTLNQINSLIALFDSAFKQCMGNLDQVDIDLAKMNATRH